MEITELKEVYPEFKFWKDRYTSINKSSDIIIAGSGVKDTVTIIFSTPEDYYYLEGTIRGNSKFIDWLNEDNKIVKVSMDALNQIRSALKKNVYKIEYDNESFNFYFKSKETEEDITISIKNTKNDEFKKIIDKGNLLKSRLTQKYELKKSFLNDNLFEVFLKDNTIVDEKTTNKVLEIPSNKLQPIQKAEDTIYNICISERDAFDQRLVSVESSSDSSGISFTQIFNTI